MKLTHYSIILIPRKRDGFLGTLFKTDSSKLISDKVEMFFPERLTNLPISSKLEDKGLKFYLIK